MLHVFPDKDLTFKLGGDLDAYGFKMDDSVRDIFAKYFKLHTQIDSEYQIS